MTYFKLNNKPMVFHLAGLDKDEYQEYKALVQAGGGEVSDNSDECFIIFTKRNLYQPGMYPRAAVYDIEFIKKCNHTRSFKNPARYSSLGSLKSRDIITLLHFLHGYHSSKGRSACLTQPQESIIVRSESIDDEVSSPSRQPSLSPDFVSAENSDITCIEQATDDNETTLVRNPMVASPPVDESQAVVTKQDMRKCVPVMAGGDIAENNNDRTNDTNEKRPCRLEYHRDVVPKMKELAEQQRRDLEKRRTERASLRETTNFRQQRSPRTITKRRRVVNGTQEEDYPIKIEILSDEESATTVENIECTSNAVNESDTYTLIRISPKSEQTPDSPSSSDNETPAKKSRYLRVIAEARQRFSSPSYIAEKKKRNENWIESKNFRITKTATKNDHEESHEEINYIRPIVASNPNQATTVSNHWHNRMKKRSPDEKNAERETRRTDLPVNMKKNEKRRNENLSTETLQEISNGSKNPHCGRRLFNREDNPVKTSSEVQKKSQMLDVCKRLQPTRIVQEKKSKQNNNTINFIESSTSNFSDSTERESIPEEVVHRNLRKTKDDSSWNKPGPSGLGNKQKKYNNNDEESGKANGPKKPIETGKRNSPRSNRVTIMSDTSSESDDDDDFEVHFRHRENSRKRSPNKASTLIKRVNQCRKPFSQNEKRRMIRYLIDKDKIDQAKGSKVWQRMIKDGYLPHRTWESLKNNMKRYILPCIEDFGLDDETLAKFVMVRERRK